MASIGNDKGLRRILFVCPKDASRKTVRLGRMSKRDAEGIKLHVEQLITASITGHALDSKTSQWLRELPDFLHDRMAGVGIVQAREAVRLADFTRRYIDGRTDLKPASIVKLEQARDALVSFFDGEKPLRRITAGDAQDWRLSLIKRELSKATVQRLAAMAKQMMGDAVRRHILDDDPFTDLPSGVVATRSTRYVTADEADRIMDKCPSVQWRLLFALARYAGLRIPSESHGLTWDAIDWEQSRMTVKSPKTEQHEGHEERVVPIFPKLMPYLQAAFDEAQEGAEKVITLGLNNLHRNMVRIIRLAGVDAYSKPFHTLRSSCQTELAMTFPDFAVAKWIGNSVRVADKHYLRMTSDLMDRAAGVETEAAQNAAQSASEVTRIEPKSVSEQAAKVRSEHAKLPGKSGSFRSNQNADSRIRTCDLGLMKTSVTDGKPCDIQHLRDTDYQGGTESGTLDAELARLMAVWSSLSPAVREQILSIAEG